MADNIIFNSKRIKAFKSEWNGPLDGYEKFIYESCNNSIGQQEKASTKNGITVYYCCDYSKDKKYDLIVDLNQMKVEKTP